ncbi:MAG: hypothetical protein AABZ74_01825 [Cyanobacteriota bacterium]
MKKRILLGTLIFLFGSLYNLSSYAENKNQFPKISGKNLENKEYNLPSGFEGKINLVFIAFLRDQQKDIDKWLPLAKTLSKKYETLRYYELHVLNETYARWFIDAGMKAGISDKSQREKTITIYTNKKKFLESLDISNEKEIQILLLDSNGKIIWSDKGDFSKNKADSLQTILSSKIEK